MFSVGMIGAGIIGASHLAAVAGHPDTRLAAVADIAPGRRRSRRPHPDGAHAYESYEEMLEREKLEACDHSIFPTACMKHVFWPVRKKESISCWKNPCPFPTPPASG